MQIGAHEFRPRWFGTILFGVFLALFVALGFWQLERADGKRALLEAAARGTGGTMTLTGSARDRELPLYQQVRVIGTFDPQYQWLLDNQVYQGRAGFHVISLLIPQDGRLAVLVNRGWVPQGWSRSDLPELPLPAGAVEVRGYLVRAPGPPLQLGPEPAGGSWPRVVQRVEIEAIERELRVGLLPFVIRLEPEAAVGFEREWEIVEFPPERHVAYAVQWFAMALALTIIYLAMNTKKIGGTDDH